MKWVTKASLTPAQRKLLESCGPDAQDHPLVIDDDNRLRFRENPAVVWLQRNGKVNLNDLYLGMDMHIKSHRLGLREFYRMLGYSCAGYLEVFHDHLEVEKRLNERARSEHEKRHTG